MLTSKLIAKYPQLFHMAENGSWPSIRDHGLLSTSALLTLYKYDGDRRDAIESQWREDKVWIACDNMPDAVIRDQKPMDPDRIGPCLSGCIGPNDWYKFINGKVFFWPDERNLKTFLTAYWYREKPHDVIVVDTRRLLEQYPDRIRLSKINSGSVINDKSLRGYDTFQKLSEYSEYYVKELCVDDRIDNILDVVDFVQVCVGHMNGAGVPEIEPREMLWRR